MIFDWELVGLLTAWTVNLVTLVGVYYGLKMDNAKLGSDIALSILTERTNREKGDATVKSDLGGLITAAETCISDLTHRVTRLESGRDEWTKELRDRTHDLAVKLDVVVLKVDRLENRRV